MKQLSEQDRQRIENDSITHKEYKILESVSAYSEHRRWKNGYTTGATAERLLAESEKEELRKGYHDLQTDLARSNSKQIDLQSELTALKAERERVIRFCEYKEFKDGLSATDAILSILKQKE